MRRRFEALNIRISARHKIKLTLNPYNTGEDPLGIQSVSIGLMDAEYPLLTVNGPNMARTIVQRKASKATDNWGDFENSGVYACDYENL